MTSGPPPVAVLLGGGVESTSLVRRFLAEGQPVVPVHVHCGLIWDNCESRYARRFCEAVATPILAPLVEIRLPLHDFLAGHWAANGNHVPRAGASSSDLEIPLRNLTLLSFALHRVKGRGISTLAIGTTADNSFCDGSREYFDLCEQVLSLEAGRPVTVLTPLIGVNKTEVIRNSDAATLALSFSCVNPRGDLHCGECIKCGKRKAAFQSAGGPDPTIYAA